MLAIQKCHHRPQCSLVYRADQIVSVLNNWLGCHHWYSFW
jgi:hypothetical protein